MRLVYCITSQKYYNQDSSNLTWACSEKAMSSPCSVLTSERALKQCKSSIIQSTRLASWASTFPMVSTIGLTNLRSCCSFCQSSWVWRTIVTTSDVTGESPFVFFHASGWKHTWDIGSFWLDQSEGFTIQRTENNNTGFWSRCYIKGLLHRTSIHNSS